LLLYISQLSTLNSQLVKFFSYKLKLTCYLFYLPLEKISGFVIIANFAYSHHENYNGTGYPQGLKGDEIPFESQIIQVGDAYDAMTSERTYRKALSSEEALEIIKKEIGMQFNPEIAKVAIELFSNIDEVNSL
jgi:HD-GYP domain-containing protein (c-di-GMP phosphodiesterase class II)